MNNPFDTTPQQTFEELVKTWQKTAVNLGPDEGGMVVVDGNRAVATIPNERTGAVMRYEATLTSELVVNMSIWVNAEVDERFPNYTHTVPNMVMFFAYALAFVTEVSVKMQEVFPE